MSLHAEAGLPGLSLFLGEQTFEASGVLEHFFADDLADFYRSGLRSALR